MKKPKPNKKRQKRKNNPKNSEKRPNTKPKYKDILEKKQEQKADLEKLRKDLWAHETASWVLAALGLILIIFLVIYIVWSYVSQKQADIEQIYLQELKSQLGKADFSGKAVFSVPKVKNKNYYLAYFSNKAAFIFDSKTFLSTEYGKKHLCICRLQDSEADCSDCVVISLDASFNKSTNPWAISLDNEIKIQKTSNQYVFSIVHG